MRQMLAETKFDFLSGADKAFIIAFTEAVARLGYDFGGSIGNGYCWGKHMIIYARTTASSKKVAARIYLREDGIVLRLYLNDIDKHRAYIESAPAFIKDVFTGKHADCNHCPNKKNGVCAFQKRYTLDNRLIEKCSGVAFEFWEPNLEKLPGYVGLLAEFFHGRKHAGL